MGSRSRCEGEGDRRGAAQTRAFGLLVNAKNGEVRQQPVRPACGSDQVLFDAHAAYDARTGRYELTTPHDRLDCQGRGVSGVQPHWRPMRPLTDRLECAESLLAELASLLATAARSGVAPRVPPATVKALAERWRASGGNPAMCTHDLEGLVDENVHEGAA